MSKDRTLRSNEEIFIRAILSGYPVAFRGHTWKLIKAGDDITAPSGVFMADYDVLAILATSQRGTEIRDVVMPSDISFNDLMHMSHDMTEEERIGIVASQVLMAEHSRKR